MIGVVGVRFKRAGKVYYFDPSAYPIAVGAKVVVETARGVEYGEVAVGPKDVAEEQVIQPLKKVLRIGTDRDAIAAEENRRKEREAFSAAQRKIEGHLLEMNLVDVEYTFDSSKVIFYFTAEGRIDFRDLVKDLASLFRTRIEMRQIGVRDEAKLLGGIGPCGRILCCTAFLGDFAPVSIRMAKDQNLSLNPSKISGLCGRLMCCLRYEQETYDAAKKDPTLAPSYVAPMPLAESERSPDGMEDQLMPPIGIRMPTQESGLSARIAEAAGITDQAPRRQISPPEVSVGGQSGAKSHPRPQDRQAKGVNAPGSVENQPLLQQQRDQRGPQNKGFAGPQSSKGHEHPVKQQGLGSVANTMPQPSNQGKQEGTQPEERKHRRRRRGGGGGPKPGSDSASTPTGG